LENTYLGLHEKLLATKGGINTAKEIQNQPAVWRKTFDYLLKDQACHQFIQRVKQIKDLDIVLTGAGSSAFIGQTVDHIFLHKMGKRVRPLSTTSLTTHFSNYISSNRPLLMVSFARSGNSPESLAVVDIAESFVKEVYHLAITCNADGKLARKVQSMHNGCSIILPPETEDEALAMTGSFTSMTLVAILSKQMENIAKWRSPIDTMCHLGHSLITDYHAICKEIASLKYNRIIFLGSGPLLGIATESHLKVQELTDGEVVGKFDSFLGFRHGPKVVARENSILVYLFSPDPEVFRYEKELADEIRDQKLPATTVGVFSSRQQADQIAVDYPIIFDQIENNLKVDLLIPLFVIPAQMIGFFTSLKLGLKPDAPSRAGAITRVVKPFTIFTDRERESNVDPVK